MTSRGSFGERRIRFAPVPDFFARVERIGHVPLPPYIHRDSDRGSHGEDRDDRPRIANAIRRSTLRPGDRSPPRPRVCISLQKFCRRFGNEASRLLRLRCMSAWVLFSQYAWRRWKITSCIASVTKFQPGRPTRSTVPRPSAGVLSRWGQRRFGRWSMRLGRTRLIERSEIYRKSLTPIGSKLGQAKPRHLSIPDTSFRVVDALLTNFHLPQSTLLMLVCALGGQELVLRAYRHAVEAGYRFYSYGDCMFVE